MTTPTSKNHHDIGLFDRPLSKDICRQLRDLYDLYEDHAIREDRIGRKDGAVYLRSNPEGKEMRKVVEPILFECADEYFAFYGHDNWKEVTAPVTYKIQKTEAGGGFTALHFEQGMGKVSNRYAAWMFYLNSPGSCLLYTSPSPRDRTRSRMPSSA